MEMPPLPRRKTIRLQNYDYFQSGAYCVTICTAPVSYTHLTLPTKAEV